MGKAIPMLEEIIMQRIIHTPDTTKELPIRLKQVIINPATREDTKAEETPTKCKTTMPHSELKTTCTTNFSHRCHTQIKSQTNKNSVKKFRMQLIN